MAKYEVDVLVAVRTMVEHPSLSDREAAEHVGKGRVRMAMRTLNDTGAMEGFTIVDTLVHELETS